MIRIQHISIRVKISIAIFCLIAGVSAFIYLYFPPQFQREATHAIVQKGESIAAMTAYSLAPAIAFNDPKAVQDVFETAKQNTDVVYLVVADNEGRILDGDNIDRAQAVNFRRQSDAASIDGAIYKTGSRISVGGASIGTLYLGLSLESLHRQVGETRKTVAIVSLIVFILGFLLAFGIGAVLTRPLRTVVEAVEEISKGNLSRRAGVDTEDEVGVLASSFNRMVDTLAAAQRELEEMNRLLEQRVQHRTAELQMQIDEHERTKNVLQRRESIIRAVSSVSEQFLRTDHWKNNIPSVLRVLGTAAGVSRVFVFRNENEPDGIVYSSLLYEWCAEGISSQIGNPDFTRSDFGVAGLERWMSALSGGNAVTVTLSQLPDEFKRLFREQDVQSAMFVPVFVEKEWWGFIGFDECAYEREWMPAETDALTTVARNLGAAIERGNAVAALSASEMRYRSFFDDDLTGDFIATPNGKVIDCNAAYVHIFGFSSVNDALSTGLVDLFLTETQYKDLLKLLQEKKTLSYHEISLRRRDRHPVFVVANLIGIFTPDGTLEMVRGYLFDDTRRKELEHQLLHAQKMESVGTLAGGIAHDFNNILAIIIGYTEALLKGDPSKERVQKNLQIIAKMSERGVDLVRQLLAFARKSQTHMESVNLNEIVGDTVKLLGVTFPKSITVIRAVEEGIPLLAADSTQLHQVLLNLCVNARDAMTKPGIITIGTRIVRHDELQRQYANVQQSDYVELFVSDTGEGMPPEIIGKIFEPFFTTKKLGKGTGLGLAVVFGIVESHKGIIDVESEPGIGTTFHIYFPARQHDGIFDDGGTALHANAPGQGGTILLVEDEPELRELIGTELEESGFRVLTAGDGEAALATYDRHASEIDLVVSDMGLPKMDGEHLFFQLREKYHHVKMIIASGYLEPEVVQRLELAGIADLFEKPYDVDRLVQRINFVLS